MLPSLGETFTLAGLGAALMGIGSALTGWAALRAARKPKEEEPDVAPVESGDPDGE